MRKPNDLSPSKELQASSCAVCLLVCALIVAVAFGWFLCRAMTG